MTEEQLETLGGIADSIDNILAATELPLPAEVHLRQSAEAMREWSEKIKILYRELSSSDPWPY